MFPHFSGLFSCFFTTIVFTTVITVASTTYVPSHSPRHYLVSLRREIPNCVDELKAHLDSIGVDYKIMLDLTQQVPDVYHGVSVQLSEESDVEHLKGFTHMERINTVRVLSDSRAFTTHQNVPRDRSINQSSSAFPPHLQTRVSELHKMGIYGQGIKVALIDYGVDCTHPALGSGFGPGFKIGFGRSYIDDHDDNTNSPESHGKQGSIHSGKDRKPPSPCTQCTSHGTHTAGIVAASDAGRGFTGVAPNVTLGSYLAGCGPDAGTTEDIFLAAFLQAHKDGADIISTSVGRIGGWGNDGELSTAVNKLVQEKGAIIIAPGGNSGQEGLFFADHPASARNVISVGSVDSESVLAGKFKASTGKELTMYRINPLNLSGEHPIYLTAKSTDVSNDACDELPRNTPNLTNHVVLVKRGTCLFTDKMKNVAAKGGRHILFYMNSNSIVTFKDPDEELDVSMTSIPLEDGRYIFNEAIKDPTGFKVSFPPTSLFYAHDPYGGLPSDFSTYGPTFDFESPQPAINGVGGNVVSTTSMKEGGYGVMTGTSMAAPQIAGIAALVLSARGKKFTGLTMRSRLATTGKPLDMSIGEKGLDTVVHQGGGLIDAYCAVWTNTSISTPSLVLNDSASFRGNQEFKISNDGSRLIHYVLSHRPALTFQTFSPDSKYRRPDPVPRASNNSASAHISPMEFQLKPGGSQVVRVKFTPPGNLDSRWLGVYSGYIVMNSDLECECHNVPYYGVAGSLKKQSIIDRGADENKTAIYPYLSYVHAEQNSTNPSEETPSPLNTAFIWDLKKNNATALNYRTTFGSAIVRADILTGNAVLSNATSNHDFEKSFRGSGLIGMVADTENLFVQRTNTGGSISQYWNGTITSKGNKKAHRLPNGTYKILLRALRVTGQEKIEQHWDFWVSPVFQIRN